jgi:hypothetical protein
MIFKGKYCQLNWHKGTQWVGVPLGEYSRGEYPWGSTPGRVHRGEYMGGEGVSNLSLQILP